MCKNLVRFARLMPTLLLAAVASAQAPVDAGYANWSAVLTRADLSAAPTGLSLWLDVHGRRGAAGTGLLLRPALGYRLSPVVSVWAGYGWMPVFPDDRSRVDEHRVWQQLVVSDGVGDAVKLQARTRVEQRFGGGPEVAHRVREFVRLGWSPENCPFGLVVWDEIFFGLNDVSWGPGSGFDQNRLFTGLSAPIQPRGRVEVGYLVVNANRSPNTLEHVLAMNVFLSTSVKRQGT